LRENASEQIRSAIRRSGKSLYRISQEAGVCESVLSRFMAGGSMRTDTLDRLVGSIDIEIRMSGVNGGANLDQRDDPSLLRAS
jgi:hypothetical protein